MFGYAERNGFRTAFLTVHRHHAFLIYFLEQFGFRVFGEAGETGELVYAKSFGYPGLRPDLEPLEVHTLFGPSVVELDRVRCFAVPILPKWFGILFPDCDEQKRLIVGADPCGNAISKAYLCNAGTTKLREGDVLLFYRSSGKRHVRVVGVVEDRPLRSTSPQEIARYVGKRTVYTMPEIEGLAKAGAALAIRFRQALALNPPLSLKDLKANGVLADHPQTVQQVRAGGMEWLKATLKERFYCPSGPSSPKPS